MKGLKIWAQRWIFLTGLCNTYLECEYFYLDSAAVTQKVDIYLDSATSTRSEDILIFY
jgi:hypothetical protein